MTVREIEWQVEDGALAGLDFGGQGTPVLLVHGAAAWRDVAEQLRPHCHPIAIDMRGHGQTRLDSNRPDQYWRDLAAVGRGWAERPVLVGHSTGGYAIAAATAARLVEPAALCIVDGLVLDERAAAAAAHAEWTTPEAAQRLFAMFRYGWTATTDQRDAYLDEHVRGATSDWLNAGARPELVREVAARGFVPRGEAWVRRPTLEEIRVAGSPDPDAPIYPSVDLYARLTCPLTVVLATSGFYAHRRAEVCALVGRGSGRRLVEVDSNHNVPMTQPAALAGAILDLVRASRT